MLGLRIMALALGQLDQHSEQLRSHFVSLLKEREVEGSVTLLGQMATKALMDVASIWIVAIIKTVSHSVGMEELSETYGEVLTAHRDILAVQIIDASIRLDHFGDFPTVLMERLARQTRHNFLAFKTLRNLLLVHFQLYKTSTSTRDRMWQDLFD